jgi:hypothetical protein
VIDTWGLTFPDVSEIFLEKIWRINLSYSLLMLWFPHPLVFAFPTFPFCQKCRVNYMHLQRFCTWGRDYTWLPCKSFFSSLRFYTYHVEISLFYLTEEVFIWYFRSPCLFFKKKFQMLFKTINKQRTHGFYKTYSNSYGFC